MRALVCGLLLGALAAAGCAPVMIGPWRQSPTPPSSRAASPTTRTSALDPITAEKVRADNARVAAQALRDEIDREQEPRGKP